MPLSESPLLSQQIIGDDIAFSQSVDFYGGDGTGPDGYPRKGPLLSAPPDTVIAYGWLARVMLAIPSRDIVVVSMGQTVGQSESMGGCDYDEGYSMTLIWQAIGEALQPTAANASGVVRPEPAAERAAPAPKPAVRRPRPQQAVSGGSCFCYCPPNEGYGQCFPAANQTQCQSMGYGGDGPNAADFCPQISIARQCSQGGGWDHKGGGSSATALCNDSSAQGFVRGLQCTDAPNQTKQVVQPAYCQPGSEGGCPDGEKCPDCGQSYCKCKNGRRTTVGACGDRSDLLDTLYCDCVPMSWGGCDWHAGVSCDASSGGPHQTADGSVRRPPAGVPRLAD